MAENFAPDYLALRFWLLIIVILTILGAVTGIGYFMIGGVFAPISDLIAMLIGITLCPVILGLYRMNKNEISKLKRLGMMMGWVAIILMTIGSLVLVLHGIGVPGLPAGVALGSQFAGVFFQGIWLLLTGLFISDSGRFTPGTSRAMIIAGAGYILFGISSPFGSDSPVASLGALVGLITFIIWAFRLRKELNLVEQAT